MLRDLNKIPKRHLTSADMSFTTFSIPLSFPPSVNDLMMCTTSTGFVFNEKIKF